MKKLLLLLTVIGIGLTSCNGKYTVAKRKYNKGFYVSRSHSNTTKPSVAINDSRLNSKTADVVVKEVINPITTEIQTPNHSITNLEQPVLSKPLINKVNEATFATKNTKVHEMTSSTKEVKAISPSIKPISISKNILHSSKKDSDTNLILLIILCFLWWLNLIAVYIHDGKDITLNFWITLLLDFTFIGGVIFSLLVVLDIVDLR